MALTLRSSTSSFGRPSSKSSSIELSECPVFEERDQSIPASPSSVRRCAVIDGMNLLHTASRGSKADRYPELDAIVLLVAARELLLKGFDVRIFIPIKRMGFVKNRHVIEELEYLNIFEFTYSNYDDVVFLQYAASSGGFVISRDKFRDVLPRMSYASHLKERLCHALFLPENGCKMTVTVYGGEDDIDDQELPLEEDPPGAEKRDDVTELLQESMTEDPRSKIFFSSSGDFDFESTSYTRTFFTPERHHSILDAVEDKLERLYYNARRRETGLSLTSLVYLTCYYKPEELEEAFHVLQTKERQSMRQVLDAKEQIQYWFKKAVKARCVDKALEREPTTFVEMLGYCNEELLKLFRSRDGRQQASGRAQMYDDPFHPAQTATERTLYELGVDL